MIRPGRTRVRSLSDTAGRVRAVVASVRDESNLMDGENPLISKRGTTATLGKPSSMHPASFIELAGGSREGTVKGVLATDDTYGNIKAMGIAKEADKVLDGDKITKGKSVSSPRRNEFTAVAPSTKEHGSIGVLSAIEAKQGPLRVNKKRRDHGANP